MNAAQIVHSTATDYDVIVKWKDFPKDVIEIFPVLGDLFMGDIDKKVVIFIYLPFYFHFKTTYTCIIICICAV